MAVYDLKTFSDLYTAVMEELKYQSGDTNSLNKIKRDINMVYREEVAPHAQWEWLRSSTAINLPAYYSTGTAAVTANSGTVTLSASIATSKANYFFSVEGYSEIYLISAHTAGTTTLTLDSVYTGTTAATATFKIWTDTFALPTDCAEVLTVTHTFRDKPLEGVGISALEEYVTAAPKVVGRPVFFSVAEASGDASNLVIYPSITDQSVTLKVKYLKKVTALDAASDEPLIPTKDRIVLLHGALARAWKRERNEASMGVSYGLYDKKLEKMAARLKSTMDYPRIGISKTYLANTRSVTGQNRYWSNRWWKIS